MGAWRRRMYRNGAQPLSGGGSSRAAEGSAGITLAFQMQAVVPRCAFMPRPCQGPSEVTTLRGSLAEPPPPPSWQAVNPLSERPHKQCMNAPEFRAAVNGPATSCFIELVVASNGSAVEAAVRDANRRAASIAPQTAAPTNASGELVAVRRGRGHRAFTPEHRQRAHQGSWAGQGPRRCGVPRTPRCSAQEVPARGVDRGASATGRDAWGEESATAR